jgi:hypothetical protein
MAVSERKPMFKTREVVEKIGGADRDRTGGLLVANEALSQLSYSPTSGLERRSRLDFTSVDALQPRAAHHGATHAQPFAVRTADGLPSRAPSIMNK